MERKGLTGQARHLNTVGTGDLGDGTVGRGVANKAGEDSCGGLHDGLSKRGEREQTRRSRRGELAIATGATLFDMAGDYK